MKKTNTELRKELGGSDFPEGKKGLSTIELFYERKFYKDNFYDRTYESIDFWYKRPLFGLVNHKSEPVHLSEAFLKPIGFEDKSSIMAVNFVVDAFLELKSFLEVSIMQGKTNSSHLSKIEISSAWKSSQSSYFNYLENIYQVFYNNWIQNKKRSFKIETFEAFVSSFQEFYQTLGSKYPVLKSSFNLSTYNNFYSSGLVLDLGLNDDNNDFLKVEYLNDINFKFFERSCNKFGFLIDKNAPWRLVADIGSSSMKNYMKKNNTSYETLFDDFYYKTYESELEILKEYLKIFYDTFVKIELKNNFSNEEYIDELSNSFWMKIYVFFIKHEKKIGNEKRILKNALLIEERLGIDAALDFVHLETIGLNPLMFPSERSKRFE